MRLQLQPGAGWVWARRAAQLLAFLAIVFAPLLGGWQRMDRTEMAVFSAQGWDLPDVVRDRLPMAERPAQAYDALVLRGGGSAVEYASVPVIDPVAGAAVIVRGPFDGRLLLAFALPLLFAALVGRVFCGWLCPFGVVARGTRALLTRMPWKLPAWELPARRPLRWVVLGGVVLAGAVGAHAVLFLFLPHLLVQQTVYAMWLLGGGGAILGALVGLIVAGVFFGPTTYCATLCPTGAALGLVGRRKLVHLTLQEPAACGKHCHLCNSACWLGLDPASGDPGPDCDSCGRCTAVCPRTNMRVAAGAPRRRHLPVVAAALLVAAASPSAAQAETRAPHKPTYILDGERVIDGVTVAVSAVDHTGVKLDLDWASSEQGVEISVFIARGARGAADERGVLPGRDVYHGALTVVLDREDEERELVWTAPNSPVSTQGTSIYRRRTLARLRPGDEVIVRAVPGWLQRDVRFTVPAPGTAPGWRAVLGIGIAAALVFGGLCSLALAVPDQRH